MSKTKTYSKILVRQFDGENAIGNWMPLSDINEVDAEIINESVHSGDYVSVYGGMLVNTTNYGEYVAAFA